MNNESSDGKARSPKSPDTSTTLTTRIWVSAELEDFRNLFLLHEARSILPPDLVELADSQMAGGNGWWPRWLMLGLAVKIARRWVEEQLTRAAAPKKEPAPVNTQPAAPSEPVPASRSKKRT